MRLIVLFLFLLLVGIQYPLWLGKGGWLRVADLEQQVAEQEKKNTDLRARNARLAGEVQDLTKGTHAIEERARSELGMIRHDEVFVQFVAPSAVVGIALDEQTHGSSGAAAGLARAAVAGSAPRSEPRPAVRQVANAERPGSQKSTERAERPTVRQAEKAAVRPVEKSATKPATSAVGTANSVAQKPAPKKEPRTESASEMRSEAKPGSKAGLRPEPKSEPKSASKPAPKQPEKPAAGKPAEGGSEKRSDRQSTSTGTRAAAETSQKGDKAQARADGEKNR